ncbi:hypothetical protein TorRG33x02_046920 [Trema orientale]|uniref:Uncharacterized protein n=1 Tax=Trema orientale TaxID=63057 RepID=A0A2P5FP02_TREOI|nr:hypothetical protein TorRG33x02_046920 [Trema orientale]
MEAGISPENEFEERPSRRRRVRLASELGIDPEKRLLERSRVSSERTRVTRLVEADFGDSTRPGIVCGVAPEPAREPLAEEVVARVNGEVP